MYHDYLHILDDRIKYPTFQGMLILNSSSSRSLMLVNLDVQLQNFIDIPLWAIFIIHPVCNTSLYYRKVSKLCTAFKILRYDIRSW